MLIYLLGRGVGVSGLALAVAVLQAAMAPMVSTAILAAQYNLDREVATMALGAGLVISLVSVPLLAQLLP